MLRLLQIIGILTGMASSTRFNPIPAFPVPSWSNGVPDLQATFDGIKSKLEHFLSSEAWDGAYVSVEVTSATESLWFHHHTARKRNTTRPGTEVVNGDSLYRIASITKTFTVLGLLYQHEAGTLNLDSPISRYIPELSKSSRDARKLSWKDITLRSLASQLSGIPRDFAQSDLAIKVDDPTKLGLPPNRDEHSNFDRACNNTDVLAWLKLHGYPVFAPNQKSTYSNLAFDLLGIALEHATNTTYEQYMQDAIFTPLNMTQTTISTPPSDTHAILPIGNNHWDVKEGAQNPTCGIYSSTTDMSKYLRYILTHYNNIAKGVNWLLPSSWSGGINSFYGMPWEIFRSGNVLQHSQRPVTFVTKGGGVPGYTSKIILLPEYNLGITILVGHDGYNLLDKLLDIITIPLARAAEISIWTKIDKAYSGIYTASDLNSSLTLTTSHSTGLTLTRFISNSTDILPGLVQQFSTGYSDRAWKLHLAPTLLFKDEKSQQGEIWRVTAVRQRDGLERGVWDDFSIEDVDTQMYGGLPLTEVVFWHEEGEVELPAWRVRMSRMGVEGNRTVLREQV